MFADETRPFLQGARLTAWELMRDGIETTVITDNMAGALMRQGKVDLVVVGADRIAANGDTANKIGTYARGGAGARAPDSVLRRGAALDHRSRHRRTARTIPIEERNAARGDARRRHAAGARPARWIWNPAFDVTPHRFIAGIITERGIFRPPYTESLKKRSRSR